MTFKSLIPCIIEEAYELVDTIREGDVQHMKEELGDVLLHVVMLSEMASETDAFSINDVIQEVSDKMIHRHPHVFGDAKADTVSEVMTHWEAAKGQEKKVSFAETIPRALPALVRAQKTQKKAAKQGFDWPDVSGAIHKLEEEVQLTEADFVF